MSFVGRRVPLRRLRAMTTLKIGIADTEEMKARTLRIARGEEQPSPDDPKVWFISTESCLLYTSPSPRD